MGCCIAIAFVIALVRGAYFRVFPHRRPPEGGFAPPAVRTAPGAVAGTGGPPPAPQRTPVRAARPVPFLFGAVALTAILYAVASAVLFGGDSPTGHHHGGRPHHDAILAALVVAALAAAAALCTVRRRRARTRPDRARARGRATDPPEAASPPPAQSPAGASSPYSLI